MADSYSIIDGQVVPFHGGRKDTNTGAWRDATPMELQLQAELCAAERALEEAAAALEAAREDAERYRWLRERMVIEEIADEARAMIALRVAGPIAKRPADPDYYYCGGLDAAIDKARGKGEG